MIRGLCIKGEIREGGSSTRIKGGEVSRLNVKVSQIRNEIIKEETGGTCETVGFANPLTIRPNMRCYIYQCLR